MADQQLHIIELRAENFKRLRAVTIKPDGNIVEVTGANGAGKSSVLDAIEAALGGAKSVPEKPVRDGEKAARVVVNLGELTVERVFDGEGRSVLRITSADRQLTKPQTVLDALYNRMSFDPFGFMRLDSRAQRQQLADSVGLSDKLEEIEGRRAKLYADRTDNNRELDSVRKQHQALPVAPDDTPAEPVSIAQLMEKRAQLVEHNRQNEAYEAQARAADIEVGLCESATEEWESRVKEAEEQLASRRDQLLKSNHLLAEARSRAEIAQAQADAVTYADLSAVDQSIMGAEEINRNVELREQRTTLNDLASALQKRVDELTDQICSLDGEKSKAVEAVTLPIEGLSFSEDGLTYNGLPLAQASQSEQLRVSTAIAAAQNRSLRVILIRDGSLLDTASRTLLATLAAEHNCQVWLERVDESGEVGIYLEDGEVRPSAKACPATEPTPAP